LALDPHDTLSSAPAGKKSLTEIADQFVPFQRYAFLPKPTARQKLADGQDTPYRTPGPDSAGRVWTDHRLPFQRSASGIAPIPVSKVPTASHAVVETHETPLNELESAPGGFGLQ
jgi:hypothetical protein